MVLKFLPINWPRRCINDIAIAERGHLDSQYIPGVTAPYEHVAFTPGTVTYAASHYFPASLPIGIGSLVEHDGVTYFVESVVDGHARLFHDATNSRPDAPVPLGALTHLPQQLELLDMRGIASPHTRFGIGLCGRAKHCQAGLAA